MRKHPRVDANHADIRQALRDLRCPVLDLAAVGGGCPDLAVLLPGARVVLVEVKTPDGTLTEAQGPFHAVWPVVVVRSVDDAIRLVQQAARSSV